MTSRIYLDNAATSFPKPESVYLAMDDYNRHLGAAVGRGAYAQAVESARIVERCRHRAAMLLNAESDSQIIFTFNGTDSLNMAIHGLLNTGDHVVTSTLEHNSVLRPLRELQHRRGIEVTCVSPRDGQAAIDPADFRAALRPNTKLVCLIHASNVTGALQPIADVGAIAHAAGVAFLVDAAQTAGHIPIDVRDLPIDLLACPGHKGLLGPLGTGLLYLRPGIEERVSGLRQGGTGSQSEMDQQPASLPDKYEPGNHNAPGLAGLDAGLGWVLDRGIPVLQNHEQQLLSRLSDGLAGQPGIICYGPTDAAQRVGVFSLNLSAFEPQVLAAILDDSFGVQTRAGLHCAPGVHRTLGTLDTGGTVRLSVGPFTTDEDIDNACQALRDIAAAQ